MLKKGVYHHLLLGLSSLSQDHDSGYDSYCQEKPLSGESYSPASSISDDSHYGNTLQVSFKRRLWALISISEMDCGVKLG